MQDTKIFNREVFPQPSGSSSLREAVRQLEQDKGGCAAGGPRSAAADGAPPPPPILIGGWRLGEYTHETV